MRGVRWSPTADVAGVALQDAKQLKWNAMLRKYGPVAATSVIVLVFLYVFFGL